jgi:hypothetical protein
MCLPERCGRAGKSALIAPAMALLAAQAWAGTAMVADEARARLRAMPSADAPVVAVLAPGTPLTVLASGGAYTQVATQDGQRGWVSDALLARSGDAAAPAVRDENLPRALSDPPPPDLAAVERGVWPGYLAIAVAGMAGGALGYALRAGMCRRRHGWLETRRPWRMGGVWRKISRGGKDGRQGPASTGWRGFAGESAQAAAEVRDGMEGMANGENHVAKDS